MSNKDTTNEVKVETQVANEKSAEAKIKSADNKVSSNENNTNKPEAPKHPLKNGEVEVTATATPQGQHYEFREQIIQEQRHIEAIEPDYMEPIETNSTASTSPSEKYRHDREKAHSVWFSGLLTGESYVPRPKTVPKNELDDSKREELLSEKSYVIPRGYAYREENLPNILRDVPLGTLRSSLMVYIACSAVAFVFLLASSCPITWYRGRNVTLNGVNYKNAKITMWWEDGLGQGRVRTEDLWTCPIQKHFRQGIAAATIIACISTFFSCIFAIIRLQGSGSYGAPLLFGFIGFFWTIAANGMSISEFYRSRCGQPRLHEISRLDAGFALTLLSWILLLTGELCVICATRLNIGPVLKVHRVMDTYYFLLLAVSLLFCVVANAQTIWKRRFNDNYITVVRVTYWHTEVVMANGESIKYNRPAYRCSAYNKRIKASISFLILGTISLFGACLFAIWAHSKHRMRKAASAFGIISSIFLIISWVTAVAVFYRKSCTNDVQYSVYRNYPGVPSGLYEGLTNFPGYGIQEGVVLVIVAWLLCTAGTVLNMLVPTYEKKTAWE